MRKYLAGVAGLIALAGMFNVHPVAADPAVPPDPAAQHASHDAQACWVTTTTLSCYPSEAAMDTAIAAAQPSLTVLPAGVLSTCPTVLKLYDGTGYNPAVLALGTRGTWINLNSYGFAWRTSSYIIGSCSVTFTDSGFITYPGYTGPGAAAPAMSSGWDNRIAFVYIY